jgi:hypothetical protein
VMVRPLAYSFAGPLLALVSTLAINLLIRLSHWKLLGSHQAPSWARFA